MGDVQYPHILHDIPYGTEHIPDVQKMYTSSKPNCLIAREDKLVKLVLFVIQDFNLNFDTWFAIIGQKSTELWVQEDRITEQPETRTFDLYFIVNNNRWCAMDNFNKIRLKMK